MKYVPNPTFEKLFLASREGQELVEEGAQDIADRAKSIAPEDEGNYIDGIKGPKDSGGVPGKVIATDFKSHWIEWGSANNETYAPLRRAAEQIVGTENVRAESGR